MLSLRSSHQLHRIPSTISICTPTASNALASSSSSSRSVASRRRRSSPPSALPSRTFSSSASSFDESDAPPSARSSRPGSTWSTTPARSGLSWRDVRPDASTRPSSLSFPALDSASSRPSLSIPRNQPQEQSTREIRRPAYTESDNVRTSHQLPHLFPNVQRKSWTTSPRSSSDGGHRPEPQRGSWRDSSPKFNRPDFTPREAPALPAWGGGPKRPTPSQNRNGEGPSRVVGTAAREPRPLPRLAPREPDFGGFGLDTSKRAAPASNAPPVGFKPLTPPPKKAAEREWKEKEAPRAKSMYKPTSRNQRKEQEEEEDLEPAPKRRPGQEKKEIFIPNVITVERLAQSMGVRIRRLQNMMKRNGLQHTDSTHKLSAEDASIVAEDMGYSATVDAEKSFDVYPAPIPADMSPFPLRPPIVTIMGHVDHGKTTLLDTLRKASVAKGEAGGITQHIGAFSVSIPPSDPNSTQPRTICFLDTPGHAAFTAMRARGAQVTDIIILVVAADDGVMPQTREVIKLAEETPNVQLVVAINKVDKHKANVEAIKSGLGGAGVMLEDIGGDVPAVEVSGLTGQGLDVLMETVSTLAEVAELRAEVDMGAEGYVLESQIEQGRGITATCLVVRGTLKPGALLLAGTATCKVRTLTDDKGKTVKSVLPGFPVVVTGWATVPSAGDEILQAPTLADQQNAIRNRQRQVALRQETQLLEVQNEQRRIHTAAHDEEVRKEKEAAAARRHAYMTGQKQPERERKVTPKAVTEDQDGPKVLKLFVKGDVSGTVEAVVETLKSIGNAEAKCEVIGSAVGDVSKGDVSFADAAGATIVGFSVKADRQVASAAAVAGVPILLERVIYRLVEQVVARTEDLLEPVVTVTVLGEATVQEVFEIKASAAKTLKVAGCRVNNGTMNKKEMVRVMRKGEEVFRGTLDTMRRVKDEVTEVSKGVECGLNLHGFSDLEEGDSIQSIQLVSTRRKL